MSRLNYVHVADSELADSLMGAVHNFRYKVSDDDYAIRINGVSGDSSNMMLIAEIYRKDGTPVTDYLKNFPEDETDIDMPEKDGFSVTAFRSRKSCQPCRRSRLSFSCPAWKIWCISRLRFSSSGFSAKRIWRSCRR